jgi:GNAT superfamily N-acetyltransferase
MVGTAPLYPLQTVRKATTADVPGVARALARAFYDDPVMSWFFRDDKRRMNQLERGFALFMRNVYLQHDECYTTEELAGGALWAPPGKWHLGLLAQLRLLPGMTAAVGRDLPRLLRGLAFIESKHPREPHFYLGVLGVEPRWQGKGIGAALMRPVLERCDRDGVPAYLEASTPRNRALYLRNGFEVVEEVRFPREGPPAWRMWRAPVSSQARASPHVTVSSGL